MMELEYMPARLDYNHETRGNGTYLATQLPAPLEIGKVYEIAFWLHILTPETPDYARHIGITLYPGAVHNPTGKLLEGSAFLIDTVIYDTWYRVKWYIRPLCPLRYVAIGVFRNADGPPVNLTYQRNVFYIDAVTVIPVAEHLPESAAATPFCRLKQTATEDLPETVAGTTSWFAFGDSLLAPESKSALDSFAERAKRQPYSAFFVTGHTDSIGTNHR